MLYIGVVILFLVVGSVTEFFDSGSALSGLPSAKPDPVNQTVCKEGQTTAHQGQIAKHRSRYRQRHDQKCGEGKDQSLKKRVSEFGVFKIRV